MFPHLDTVIAFVVLMLVASLFITAVTQVVVSLLGLRGVNLQRGLVDLFETAYPDQEARRWAKEIARRVLRHPTISDSIFSRFSLRVDQVPFIPPETAGKLQGISASIPLLPLIMGAVGGLVITPIAMAIAKHWFADTWLYTDHLAGYVSVINFCQHPLGTGALVGAILGGLLSRWRLATSIRVEELPAILEKLAEPRSEEHTSELQSRLHLVCRLLLEKKNTAAPPTTATLPITSSNLVLERYPLLAFPAAGPSGLRISDSLRRRIPSRYPDRRHVSNAP